MLVVWTGIFGSSVIMERTSLFGLFRKHFTKHIKGLLHGGAPAHHPQPINNYLHTSLPHMCIGGEVPVKWPTKCPIYRNIFSGCTLQKRSVIKDNIKYRTWEVLKTFITKW